MPTEDEVRSSIESTVNPAVLGRLQWQSSAQDILRDLAPDTDPWLQQLLERIVGRGGIVLALLWRLDAGKKALHLEHLALRQGTPALKQLTEPALQGASISFTEKGNKVLRWLSSPRQRTHTSTSFAEMISPLIAADDAAKIQHQAGINRLITVPFRPDGPLLGGVTLGLNDRRLGPARRAYLLAICEQVELTVTHVEFCRQIRESLTCSLSAECLYRELIESATDPIFILDSNGRFVFLNRQAIALSGYSLQDMAGRSFLSLLPPQDHAEARALSESVQANQSLALPIEMNLLTRDGETIPVEFTLTTLRTAGVIDGVKVLARDVRERRRREAEREQLLATSRHVSQLLRLSFQQIGASVAFSSDLDSTLDLLVRLAAELLQADAAFLWLLESGGEWLTLAAMRHFNEGLSGEISEIAHLLLAEGFAGRVISQMRPVHFLSGQEVVPEIEEGQDTLSDGAMAGDDTDGLDRGSRSIFRSLTCLGVPLAVRRRPLGVLAVARCNLTPFSQAEVELLNSLAYQASIAIDRSQLFENLIQEKDEFEAIVRNSADGILVLDRDKHVLEINPAMERLIGSEKGEVLGKKCCDVLYRDEQVDRQCQDICPFVPGASTEDSLLASHEIVGPNGRRLTVSVSYGLVRDRQGDLAKVIAVVRDITRQAELERLRRDFVSTVSHELRTPLALIKGYAATLLRNDISLSQSIQREFLNNISQASDRLARLIEDLLTASRIEAGKLLVDRKRYNIVELVRTVAQNVSVQFPLRRFVIDIPSDPLFVSIDVGRIEQVLTNLISNAVKYSPQETPVVVKAEQVGGTARVSVADQGAGIPLESQDNVFDKFFRVETGLTRETSGMGLGLYISKSIIDAHGGEIWLTSLPGEGSTFGFDLVLMHEEANGAEA